MIPILYESSEILFNSNGLGRLRDCVSCVVTEERNGVYECDFEYPVNGQNYEEILFGRIIAVEHDDSGDVQPFDIVSATKPINGVVQFHAVHISYRLHGCVTPSGVSNVTSMSQALTTLGQYQPTPRLFSFSSDKTSTGYVAAFDGAPKTIRSVLGGVEGSILDAYGGEYEWDKFNVILHEARGTDTGFSIRYGVNMIDYNDDTDYSETYSSVIPFWMNSSDGTVIRGNRVVSSISSPIGRDMCIPLDLSDKFDSQPTTAQLESMAASILSSKKPYLPGQTITVDFLRLQDTPEYERYANLMVCKLCDTVKVIMPMYGTTTQLKVVKTVWNVLRERYDEMELGTLSTTLAEALGIDSSGR